VPERLGARIADERDARRKETPLRHFLSKHVDPVDPDGLYVLRWLNVTLVCFDADGLMKGHAILNGAHFR
jgi:hypothetical protein